MTLKHRKTVSAFLNEAIDSHSIVDHLAFAKRFKRETGRDPCWPTHTVIDTARAIERRGLGGSVKGSPKQLTAWGYEVAEACAEKFADSTSHLQYFGRGTRFRDAIAALAKAGL